MSKDNRTLGKFHLTGIPPAPRGIPQIEVTFDIDANGILHVTAKDKATGKEQAITITASSGISEAEIKKMVNDAEEHEAEDQARREAIEAKNQLDSRIYQTKKLLDENRDKFAAEDALMAEEAIKSAQEVLDANKEPTEADDLQAALESLTAAANKLAESLYKGAAGPEGGGGGDDDGDLDDLSDDEEESAEDVIDAEFEDSESEN